MSNYLDIAVEFAKGILSNPNTNFQNAEKVVKDALAHTEAFVKQVEVKGLAVVHDGALVIEKAAAKVESVAKEVADKTAPPVEPAPVSEPTTPAA